MLPGLVLCLLVDVSQLVSSQPPPPPPVPHNPNAVPGSRTHFGGEELKDTEHLKQHLSEQIEVDESKWSDAQQRFHYFTMHDLNKDQMIDGIEIIHALTHQHPDEQDVNSKPPPPSMDDARLEALVDAVLIDIDLNNDGLIDFGEYSKRQS